MLPPMHTSKLNSLLEKVKENRQLAVSLTEILHAPSLTSTTEAFETPVPNQETAVGLQRFEQADVQARLLARQKDLKVGENLDLEIELVNAGRRGCQLVRVEDAIPEGFELATNQESYRVEDGFLNMKGKRLDPLKTEALKLVMKPRKKGQFTLRPRILYVEESGKFKSHDPQPITVTVKELGISGWLKGQ